MQTFNPDSFLHTEVEGEMSTRILPIPVGEYEATIVDVKGRAQGEYSIMEVNWQINDPNLAAQIGREQIRTRQSIFLDLNSVGALDLSDGKNVQLGKLRAAVGQNGPEKWSPSQLLGQQAIVKVSHRMNGEDIYDQVSGVAPIV